MNSKLKYNEVVDAYRRLHKQAEYKAIQAQQAPTKRKWEALASLYESTIYFLTNNLTGKYNGQSGN